MIRPRNLLLLLLIIFNLSLGFEALGQHTVLSKSELEKRRREQKARIEKEKRQRDNPVYQRRKEYEKRKKEQQQRIKEMRSGRKARNVQTQPVSNRVVQPRRAKFNPNQAGPPSRAFAKFVHTAQTANRVDQILPFFTKDKRAAFSRLSAQHADLIEVYRADANNVEKVLSEKAHGPVAELRVLVREPSEVDGKQYDLRISTVKLLAENNRWRISGYRQEPEVFSTERGDHAKIAAGQ